MEPRLGAGPLTLLCVLFSLKGVGSPPLRALVDDESRVAVNCTVGQVA